MVNGASWWSRPTPSCVPTHVLGSDVLGSAVAGLAGEEGEPRVLHTEVSADPESAIVVQRAAAGPRIPGWRRVWASGRNSAEALRQTSFVVTLRLRHHCINSGYNSGRKELGGPGGAKQAHPPTGDGGVGECTFLWQHWAAMLSIKKKSENKWKGEKQVQAPPPNLLTSESKSWVDPFLSNATGGSICAPYGGSLANNQTKVYESGGCDPQLLLLFISDRLQLNVDVNEKKASLVSRSLSKDEEVEAVFTSPRRRHEHTTFKVTLA